MLVEVRPLFDEFPGIFVSSIRLYMAVGLSMKNGAQGECGTSGRKARLSDYTQSWVLAVLEAVKGDNKDAECTAYDRGPDQRMSLTLRRGQLHNLECQKVLYGPF